MLFMEGELLIWPISLLLPQDQCDWFSYLLELHYALHRELPKTDSPPNSQTHLHQGNCPGQDKRSVEPNIII